MTTKKLTRKQLYDLVWSNPISKLSEQYDLSSQHLRKICTKYDIPLPEPGHWQKLIFEKEVIKKELGHFEKWGNVKITMSTSELGDEEHYLTKMHRLKKDINKCCNDVLTVPERLTKPHVLIRSAKANLKSKKSTKSWKNLPQCIYTDRDFASIKVQKHNVPRALRILDTLFKIIEKRGHHIEQNNDTVIIIAGEKFSIRLREKHNRISVKEGSWVSSELVPNDKLAIIFDDFHGKEWVDSSSILLEEKLPQIVAFFEIRAVQEKEDRKKREIRQREYEKEREIERKIRAEKEKEIQKEKALFSFAEDWKKASTILAFIHEIEKRNHKSEKVLKWIQWAKTKVDKIDPLSDGVDEIVNTRYDQI